MCNVQTNSSHLTNRPSGCVAASIRFFTLASPTSIWRQERHSRFICFVRKKVDGFSFSCKRSSLRPVTLRNSCMTLQLLHKQQKTPRTLKSTTELTKTTTTPHLSNAVPLALLFRHLPHTNLLSSAVTHLDIRTLQIQPERRRTFNQR